LRDSVPQSEEHYALLEALESGDEAGALAMLVTHIERNGALDFETLVTKRRNRPAG
jgi:DNA-binding GntR family transcriptional regulator